MTHDTCQKSILAKDPTICSCECRSCAHRLRRNSLSGHETREGCVEMGRRCHANLPTGALGGAPYGLWGHETCEGCAEMGRRCHANFPTGALGLRRSSQWGHETCEECADMGRRCHANVPTWAFGGDPYGAAKRVTGVPKCGGGAMRTFPLGP